MVRRIAETYGAHAGFFGSWRLLRLVATHLLATGSVAVGDDLIGSVAGGHLLARLSRRFGEGVINGALTARVGIAAMDVCRPLPFAALPRPKVSNLIGRALTGLFQRADIVHLLGTNTPAGGSDLAACLAAGIRRPAVAPRGLRACPARRGPAEATNR